MLQSQGGLPANLTGAVPIQIPALLAVASLEYSARDLLLAAEYSRWRLSIASPVAAFAAEESVSERFYVMSSYHVRSWFTPGLYYSAYFPNAGDYRGRQAAPGAPAGAAPLGRAAYQHDLGVTLRFDINSNWILKVEGHRMHGTAGLLSSLNDNASLSSLTKDWGVLLLKTTAYF
jgi:hypothetical protein